MSSENAVRVIIMALRWCEVCPMTFTLTPTWHNWQQHMTSEKYRHRTWERREYCGYWIETPGGTVWLPSDSRPLPELIIIIKQQVNSAMRTHCYKKSAAKLRT